MPCYYRDPKRDHNFDNHPCGLGFKVQGLGFGLGRRLEGLGLRLYGLGV